MCEGWAGGSGGAWLEAALVKHSKKKKGGGWWGWLVGGGRVERTETRGRRDRQRKEELRRKLALFSANVIFLYLQHMA